MMFIRTTGGGSVNLAHVAKIEQSPKHDGIYVLTGIDGKPLGHVYEQAVDCFSGVFIPAASGHKVISIYSDAKKDAPLEEKYYLTDIIAWRTDGEYSLPVCLEPLCDDRHGILSPNGTVTVVGDGEYKNIATFVDHHVK